jgi:hypothetical protein
MRPSTVVCYDLRDNNVDEQTLGQALKRINADRFPWYRSTLQSDPLSVVGEVQNAEKGIQGTWYCLMITVTCPLRPPTQYQQQEPRNPPSFRTKNRQKRKQLCSREETEPRPPARARLKLISDQVFVFHFIWRLVCRDLLAKSVQRPGYQTSHHLDSDQFIRGLN